MAGCGPAVSPPVPPPPVVLRDVTAETGIAFRHTDGSSGQRYIVETVCRRPGHASTTTATG